MTKKLEALDNGELEARAELLKRIRGLQDEDHTEWEEEFLDSMESKVLKGWDLSTAEMEKLDEIENGSDYIPY